MFLRKRRKEVCMICDIDTLGDDERFDERMMFNICDESGENEILKCIEELGEPYSDVLMYYYVHEHTLKQIAQIMGEKESTVGSRLTRGRKKLMKLLVGRGYHD
jgi:RNA polymerase sigma-70 factor (ECF subfamily)